MTDTNSKRVTEICESFADRVVDMVANEAYEDIWFPIGELVFLIEMFFITRKPTYLEAFSRQIEYSRKFDFGKVDFNYFGSPNVLAYLLTDYAQFDGSDFSKSIEDLANLESGKLVDLLARRDYDFVFGASGLMVARSLNLTERSFSDECASYLDAVRKEVSNSKFGLVPTQTSTIIGQIWSMLNLSEVTNLGLAHGNLGVASAVGLICQNESSENSSTKQLVQNLILSYLETASKINESCFGNIIEQNSESLIGWCYGDLSAAVVLSQLGQSVGVENFCKKLIDRTAVRFDRGYPIDEAHICHGKAGIWLLIDELEINCKFKHEFFMRKHNFIDSLELQLSEMNYTAEYLPSDFLSGYSGACLTLLESIGRSRGKKWKKVLFPAKINSNGLEMVG